MLEDTVQTLATDPPLPEELPAELTSPELPDDATLPEPPVEVEASGSGTDDLGVVLQPPTPAAAEEEVSLEETGSEDRLIITDVTIHANSIPEPETQEVEAAAVEEEPTTATLEEEHLDEVVVDEVQIQEELEISTIATETTEEKGLPAPVPPLDAVDIASEVSEPEAAEKGPVGEELVEGAEEESNLTGVPSADKEVNPEEPAEDGDINVVLTYPEEPIFEEGGMEEVTESEGLEVKESPPEIPAVEEEAPDAPEISTEDLTEDEILLVNNDGEPEPPATDFLTPAQPTALSPERESPFTRISDADPVSEGQPDIIIPSVVEVTENNLC